MQLTSTGKKTIMIKTLVTTSLLLLSLLLSLSAFSSPFSIGDDGNLIYHPDSNGNIIPDFSHSGYQKSEKPIPTVPVVLSIAPIAGDNTQHIQNAVNQVAAMPLDENGFRGTILLQRGTYSVSGQILIDESGIVLRGEGQTDSDTVVIATGTSQRSLFLFEGNYQRDRVREFTQAITDDYVPVGAYSFNVADASDYHVGQDIFVVRPGNATWISDIGMDQIPPRDDGREIRQWEAEDYDFDFERVITGISGNTITIDIPIVQMMETRYGGGEVYPVLITGRINNVGIENMMMVSQFQEGQINSDEDHSWIAVEMDDLEHAWIRDITAYHFSYALASILDGARFVTVSDSTNLDPASEIAGGRRYAFHLDGSLVLFLRCNARNGRHDYITTSEVLGPNAFVYGTATETHSDIGPHVRWAMGTLYDNIKGGDLNAEDRNNFGSGQGWSGAQQVFWNTEGTGETAVQSPPGAINWSIGHIGTRVEGRWPRPQGTWVSHGTKVSPESLFVKQLEERIGIVQAAMILGLKSQTSYLPIIIDTVLSDE